ncbi:MAG: hypothetical protein R6U25_04375 [Alkalispirochaeta sp.]
MSRAYRAAVECIARWTGERLRRRFPHNPQIFICNASAGTRHRHRTVRAVARSRCGGGRAGGVAGAGGAAGAGNVRSSSRNGSAGTTDRAPPELWWTGSGEEARERVAARLADGDAREPVIVSLGGDGTHNHILQAGIDLGGYGIFLRLPLGSGNDAAGVESLEQALDDLEGIMTPRWIAAVRVGTPQWYRFAFNIASVGLDAYVTLLHNRWRGVLPGNTYRLLVDLAVLRYDRALRVGPLALRGTTFAGESVDLGSTSRSLVAMGVSGNLTYGDHMRVLPGAENVCVIERAGLLEKLRMKRLFYEGRHTEESITALYSLKELTGEYSGTLPLQYDGEARFLRAEDFPLTMEVISSAVRVLAPDRV